MGAADVSAVGLMGEPGFITREDITHLAGRIGEAREPLPERFGVGDGAGGHLSASIHQHSGDGDIRSRAE